MSSKGKGKIVSKDDLKRLMKETRGSIKKEAKKIDSPLAKYNSLGNLICIVCNTQVKSELLWNAHLQGRTHKENVAALKAKSEEKNTPTVQPPSALKRKAEHEFHNSSKQPKLEKAAKKKGLPEDFFDDGMAPKPLKGILKKPRLAGDYESSSEEEEEDKSDAPAAPASVGSTNTGTVSGSLPADFFDAGVAPSTSKDEEEEETKPQSMAEKLPEGFFDNPKEDAKVRQVEYKDKMDEEWELFTRAMKEQSVISEAIVEEEEEEKMAERNIEEIDDQMQRWSRVDQLHQKREEIKAKEAEKMDTGESDSEADEQDYEDFLDWRSKKAWKS